MVSNDELTEFKAFIVEKLKRFTLPNASQRTKGAVQMADADHVKQAYDDSLAITPKTLVDALVDGNSKLARAVAEATTNITPESANKLAEKLAHELINVIVQDKACVRALAHAIKALD